MGMPLNSVAIVLAVLISTFGSSMLGIAVRRRLPSHHVADESGEVLKLVLGLVATLTALVLSLLISSAYSAYDAQSAEVRDLSVHLEQIDRALARFGPEATGQRVQLHQMIANTIARVWPKSGVRPPTFAPNTVQQQGDDLFDGIVRLSPGTDLQRLAQNHAIQLLETAGGTWRLLIAQSSGSLSWPLLLVLISWLVALFFGFGLFTNYNATVAIALFVGAISVGSAIFLIVELNQPYGGWMQITSAPLQETLAHIGH
jgi:hypothetical protein